MHIHYFEIIYLNIKKQFWFIINIISAKLWNVDLKNNCKFNGRVIFRTLPNSIIKIGNNCRFNSSDHSNLIGVHCPCIISTLIRGANINIGNNCGFSGTVISSAISITIGDNVKCGANTLITDTDWHPDDFRTGKDKPIIINNNVWLGYGCIILKGVVIGENTIIGAGSVVTKSIPANVVAAGNPCKVLKVIN